MHGETAVFTIIAGNYLPYARVLMRSMAEFHPQWRRVVILADQVDGYFDPDAEDFAVVLSGDLPIPQSRWFHFKYSLMELSTAVKPYAFEHLFSTRGFGRVVYLDPDVRVYSPLDKITEALDTANIVLTPHLTGPLEDDKRPTEIDILRSGTYNLGFIAVVRSRESAAFLAWWQQRLYEHCVVDLPRGLFVDQRWIDLVPGLFEGVVIVRDAGYNVAYWNLSNRIVSPSENGYLVSGSPLAFFHFSGYDPEQPEKVSRHQNRFQLENLPPGAQQLLLSYGKELLAAGYSACKTWPYAFAFFRNGIRIPDLGRPIHHEAPELLAIIEDPFSEEGFQAFVEQWNQPVRNDDPSCSGISRLAYRIYRTRSDVQTAMPDIFGGHYKRFLEWMLASGRIEHDLGAVFLATIAEGIATCRDHQMNRSWPRPLVSDKLGEQWVRDDYVQANGSTRLLMTRLATAIYEGRPELRNFFPDPTGKDSAGFLAWFLTYGKREHYLSPAHLAPMKAQWRSILAGLPGWPTRVRYQLVLAGMAISVHVRALLAGAPVWRAKFKLRWSRSVIPARAKRRPPPEAAPQTEYGVNLVGYFHSETGVGQSVRAASKALETATVPLSLRCVEDSGLSRKQDASAGTMSTTFPYSTNLFYVNADQTNVVRRSLGDSFYRHRHNIGYWVWELDEFPERWTHAFTPYEEIWTPSTFCREAIARKSSIPVFRIPYSVAPVAPAGMDRQYFGLPPDRFLFLTAFDVLSVMERKNPLAAIQAFQRAFGPESCCQLVIKVNHASTGPEGIRALKSAASNGAIQIFDSSLRREEMDALTNCADCIVSLHRSEGFGLLIAEAMYFGKPVIVTNYSGNTDFTLPDNSLLVDFRMIPVGHDCTPYDPAGQWADPSVAHASSHMRNIAADRGLYQALSDAGRKLVRERLSPAAVGNAMRKRLEEVCPTARQQFVVSQNGVAR